MSDAPLERFALHGYLCGKLEPSALRQERLIADRHPVGFRLLVLAMLARLNAGHVRSSGPDLLREIRSIAQTAPQLVPSGFDMDGHLDRIREAVAEMVDRATVAMEGLEKNPDSGLPLVGDPDGDPRPLVCLEKGSFSFARLHAAETRLVADLAARTALHAAFPPETVESCLRAVDALPGHALHPRQREAVEAALEHPFLILTGGPGTGKTTVVSRLLLALGHAIAGFDSESVALCAPTGRAKARLSDSIRQNLLPLAALDPVAGSLASVRASTLHSLLGIRSDGGFRHGPGDPLPHRVVVLDEASMVDLPLFAALLSALSSEARLVIVGDPDQLASVEAGAVLADLVANPHLQELRVHLDHTHRNAGDIAEICQIVRAGSDVAGFLESRVGALADLPRLRGRAGGVSHLRDCRLEELVPAWLDQRFGQAMRPGFHAAGGFGDQATLLGLVDGSRILCAVNDGNGGVSTLNRLGDAWLRERFPTPWKGRFLPGQQVILTRNHPLRDLWNGDLGVVSERMGRLVALFAKSNEVLEVPVELLDGLESAWAITIHKSQGSEFEEVLLALPERDSPVLTRQILYTGLSRARRTVLIQGDAGLAAKACARSDDRPSRARVVVPGSPGRQEQERLALGP